MAAITTCFAGPDAAVDADCFCADLDEDGDVDLSDFVAFQSFFTGTK